MPNPYFLLGSVLAAIALALDGYFYGHHVEALAFDAYKSQQAAVAEKAAAESQVHARQIEQDAATKLAATEADFQGKIHDQQQTYEAALRGASDGSLSLYVHTRSCTASVPKAGASADGLDDAGTAQLSGDTAKFLVSESHRADELALKVNALQAVIAQDRQVCNGSVP